jgi:hypothetical protein
MQLQSTDSVTPELSLQQVVQQVLHSGRITQAERLSFHHLLMTDLTLDAEMMVKVRQIFDRLKMGLIKVVD